MTNESNIIVRQRVDTGEPRLSELIGGQREILKFEFVYISRQKNVNFVPIWFKLQGWYIFIASLITECSNDGGFE